MIKLKTVFVIAVLALFIAVAAYDLVENVSTIVGNGTNGTSINITTSVLCGANLSCIYSGNNVTIDDNRTLISSFNLSNVTMITGNNSIITTTLYDGLPQLANVTVSGGLLVQYL